MASIWSWPQCVKQDPNCHLLLFLLLSIFQTYNWYSQFNFCKSTTIITCHPSTNGFPDPKHKLFWNALVTSANQAMLISTVVKQQFVSQMMVQSTGTKTYSISEFYLHWTLPERTRGRPWGPLRVRIHSVEKKRSLKFYPAAQNFTNRMLFWDTHTFQTI